MRNLILGLILLFCGWLAIGFRELPAGQLAYPLLWAGLLLLLDEINFRKWKMSLMRENPVFFFGILIPLSALYWLYFELINIFYRQWTYLGIAGGDWWKTLLAFVSFATVIPAVMEIFWIFNGPKQKSVFKLPAWTSVLGLIFLALPFFSDYFWLNQLAWIGPFFLLWPFLRLEGEKIPFKKFLGWIAAAGILSGFIWEFFNFWAGAKWHYLIMPNAFHIFEMPLAGYLGFVPFALSTVAVYFFARQNFNRRLYLAAPLYLAAIFASYLFAASLH